MAASGKGTDEWRLGIELGGHDGQQASEETEAVRNYSAERLERPLCVVTAEHLGWAIVGCLALASRFVMLGARPLDSSEARYALGELALLHSGPPAGTHLRWVHLLEAAVFAALGAGDFSARIVFALSGLLLVAAGFALRRHLGRAGGLAFAGLLVLSPSVAYFSRAADGVVAALAFAMLALALFLEVIDEPGRLVAAGLGAAAGLGFATGGAALMTALFMLAALAVVGLVDALAGARVRLQVQVWWARRKALFLITTLVTAVVWLGCESDFFTRSPLYAIAAAFRSNFETTGRRGFVAGLNFYLPMLSLYEFLVVLLALIGALGVLTLRIRSRLAAGTLVWSALAAAFYLWTPARAPAFVLQMIVPMALLGAFVIQYLHHAIAWSIIRYPLAVLALLTLYVQIANNFVWYAPDASQAPWARTALLYWTEPATTLQTPVQCARVMAMLPPAGASAFFATDSPVLRWYLRALAPAAKADGAAVIVGGIEPVSLSEAQGLTAYEFELSDVWHPAWRSLSPAAALHYLLSARVWTPLESHRVTIAVRPNIPVAPTVIFAPVEPPAAGATAPAEPSAPAAPDVTTPAEPSAAASAEPSAPSTPEPAPANSPAKSPPKSPPDNPASEPAGNPGADAPDNGPG
jgi:predicted membrane-bound mannosyltransferase